MPANPFTFGNPIRDPACFYGRKAEIRQITSRLLSSAHESTSLVGERRMGKTSLLNYIAHPEVAPSLGMPPEQYCLVYLDFQGLTDITPQRFWQRVLTRMARNACDPDLARRFEDLATQGALDFFDLEDLFEGVAQRGLNIVLLMDEFEYVTQNANFGADFFGGLRALAIHYSLSLVPATRRELVDLCHSEELKGSPFFNIFASVVLRPFGAEEAQGLLDGCACAAELQLSSEEKAFIARLGGGHPFFLQMSGYYFVEGTGLGLAGEPLRAFTADRFDEQADAHFTYLWSHSSESEKITLLAVLGLGLAKPSRQTAPTLDNLKRLHPRASLDVPSLDKRGLLLVQDSQHALFSPAFERWVAREVVAPAGEEESPASVEAWLSEGGRDRLQPVRGTLPRFKKKYWPILAGVLKEISFEMIAGVALAKLI